VGKSKYSNTVSTQPVKRFFVEMLTRDIALEDALLDLLDNCVDGVQRTISTKNASKESPYSKYWVKLSISGSSFVIEDNCGGIPWTEKDRAFRMGQPPDANINDNAGMLLVGAYGIGMKRAIFKLGHIATVHTKTDVDEYEVEIPKGWMEDQENWDLPTNETKTPLKHQGTKIDVTSLREEVRAAFDSEIFQNSLIEKISTHFSIIITKGLKITVKTALGVSTVPAKMIGLRFQVLPNSEGAVIRPYFFHSKPESDLEISVVVGLREPIPDVEKALDEQDGPTYSTDYAGWTVICNDRVVLYCNRDELTGWGTADIPRYHTQFIAISGYVEFKGNPRKLPTTTTKRGLEFSSRLYQQVLDRMRDGTKMFTTYTNWWKSNEVTAKKQVAPAPSLQFADLKKKMESSEIRMTAVHSGLRGEQYRPVLPSPKQESTEVRISFYRPKKLVTQLSEQLIEDVTEYKSHVVPRMLGEILFDNAVKQHRIK
jgi:hypothetical protein